MEASVEAGIVGPESTSQLEPAFSAAAVARLHAASQASSAVISHDYADSEAFQSKVSQSYSELTCLNHHVNYMLHYL